MIKEVYARNKMMSFKKTSLILLFGVGFLILLINLISANWVSCCCAGVGWTGADCSTDDGWADCCSWTSGCSGDWTNIEGGEYSTTCCSDSDCGYGKYCNSNHVCTQGSHAVDSQCCTWLSSSHPSISIVSGYYDRKCDAWCTASGAWCDSNSWTSNCNGYWYDEIGFLNKVDCCEDADCEANQVCSPLNNTCVDEISSIYTVTISRIDSCYPDYTEECDYAKMTIQISPPDEGVSVYNWREKNGAQQYNGAEDAVKTGSNGKITHTCWFEENPETCPPIEQYTCTHVGDTTIRGYSRGDVYGIYTDEYVRVGSATGPKSNVLSFDVTCAIKATNATNATQTCEELYGECCSASQVCKDIGGICPAKVINSSDCGTRCCRCGVCVSSSCTETCENLGYECGTQIVCGVSTNCGTCSSGYTCSSGVCVEKSANVITVIYKTDVSHNGKFGGRNGLDSFCSFNKPAELECSNIQAFISTYENGAYDDIRSFANEVVNDGDGTGPYEADEPLYWYNKNSEELVKFANNWSDALDGSILVNSNTGTGESGNYWTGSHENGAFLIGGGICGSHACFGISGLRWDSMAAVSPKNPNCDSKGMTGVGNSISGTWLKGTLPTCNTQQKLLCVCILPIYDICGDGIKQIGEECDDGNIVNGDGCSSICEIEYGSYCGDGIIDAGETCDGTEWGPITGCTDFDEFTGGSLSCSSSSCLFDTSLCTGGIPGPCGNNIINTGETCDGEEWGPITGCTDFDEFTGGSLSCSFSSCLFDTSLCTGGIPGICGDGIKQIGEECDDGNIVNGDGCSSICEIESIIESCSFTFAEWSHIEVSEGTNVRLIVRGTEGCNGKNIKFEVFEDEPALIERNPAVTNPVNVVFNGGSVTGTWIAEWIYDGIGQGNPEYVFKASLVSDSSVKIDDSGELIVLSSGGFEPICIEIDSCSDYLTMGECINDECGVAEGNVHVNNPSITCGRGVTCGCEWVSDKCGAYYTSVVDDSFIGTCFYDEATEDDCEDGFLSYSWSVIWTWGENNGWVDWNDGPSSEVSDYILDGEKYYYDPDNKFDGCEEGSHLVECPASIQVEFFGVWNFIIAIVLIFLIYFILKNKKNIFKMKNSFPKRKKFLKF